MRQHLATHFVDGSGVDLAIDVEERRVNMSAYDEATQQRYVLIFDRCLTVSLIYKEWEADEVDRHNLTEGVVELATSDERVRHFHVGFVDESVLDIICRRFTMAPVAGGRYSSLPGSDSCP